MVYYFDNITTSQINNNSLYNLIEKLSPWDDNLKITIDYFDGFNCSSIRVYGSINVRGLVIKFNQKRYTQHQGSNKCALVDNLKLSINGVEVTEQQVLDIMSKVTFYGV